MKIVTVTLEQALELVSTMTEVVRKEFSSLTSYNGKISDRSVVVITGPFDEAMYITY